MAPEPGQQQLPADPMTQLASQATSQHELFSAWCDAGFTRAEALQLLIAFSVPGIIAGLQQQPGGGNFGQNRHDDLTEDAMPGAGPSFTEIDGNGQFVHSNQTMPLAAGAGAAVPVKPRTGRLWSVTVTATGTAAVTFYDNPSAASGTVIGVVPASATVGQQFVFDMPALTGITANCPAGSVAITVGYS